VQSGRNSSAFYWKRATLREVWSTNRSDYTASHSRRLQASQSRSNHVTNWLVMWFSQQYKWEPCSSGMWRNVNVKSVHDIWRSQWSSLILKSRDVQQQSPLHSDAASYSRRNDSIIDYYVEGRENKKRIEKKKVRKNLPRSRLRVYPRIPNLATIWRWVLNFTPWPLYPPAKNPITH